MTKLPPIILCGRKNNCCPTMTPNGSKFDMTDDFGGRATWSREDLGQMASLAAGVGDDDEVAYKGLRMLGHQAKQINKHL